MKGRIKVDSFDESSKRMKRDLSGYTRTVFEELIYQQGVEDTIKKVEEIVKKAKFDIPNEILSMSTLVFNQIVRELIENKLKELSAVEK